MMGPSHAAIGAASVLALSVNGPYSANLIDAPQTFACLASAAVLGAGSALVADLDQQSSTASHALPPVTTALSAVIGPISGGHRNLTHEWPGLALWGILAFLFVQNTWSVVIPKVDMAFNIGLALLVMILAALANKALRINFGPISGWIGGVVLGVAAGFLVPVNAMWIAGALVVGYASHILADMLTTEGIAFFWPLKVRLRLPILGDAGSAVEPAFVSAVVAFVAVALFAAHFTLPIAVIVGVPIIAGAIGLFTGKILGNS